ncbi:electron transfer flavoprotein-associated cytochrome b and CCG domain pair iron-sulfur cluster-binding oxidoreductase [Geobacter metallireducens GS-15]|uniref:Electron transfer flavoprotein-associated cytochrome b and CCG domain pair iron-sulfur cluster-binding oxidoreductase n=1 Tax=Geobacter metallireducens (strain ATCC 53774 / DSM 7210 / GS-15) TaxID=269799 RepID=Q39TE3_GEOMG|nr:(Fe-S)-binding protein [Geobacter metallireducens]ABB32481.1 electron transfer flavoprotein-associated cytochrome b and CCG domain pair iron-sulfur cluster-binding oxidoreductase [Geobacter metallireducens GS-15]
MTPNPTIFIPLLLVSLGIFAWGCWRRLSLVAVGTGEDRFDNPGRRMVEMLRYAFGQKRVVARPFGINHAVIFWSFLVLLIANGEFLLDGVFPAVALDKLPAGIYHPLMLLLDIVSLLALVAVCVAAVRRVASPPYPEARTVEAFVILGLIAILMLAYFGLHGAEIALGNGAAARFMPVSSVVAGLLQASPLAFSLQSAAWFCWWAHAVALLLFMAYLPNSKHLHILTAIPNCFFRRLEQPNTQPREEFAVGKKFGVARVDRFSWKDLLDSLSCTECGRCQNACPAGITGKPLNPRGIIHEIKVNLLGNGHHLKNGLKPELPLIGEGGGSCPEGAIWSCTTCGACMEACPVFIEHVPKIVQMRRHLVEEDVRFPEELLNLFENMEGRSNPWGIAPTERTKWTVTLDVKPYEAGKTEYLFYVGCAGSFDSRNKHVTVALAQLLDRAGVSWGVLGKDEKCCGDGVRRLGNEYLFDKMAKENVELFKQKGITKVVTQCPHCFSTLKNDYRQYGLELEVIHHAELLRDLVKEGRLKLDTAAALGATVFHDSCYLGRHNDVYDAPRDVIRAATGSAPADMERNRNNAFCCGAGGGRMWMEEHTGKRINLERVEEALRQKPDTICVSCPYCMTMFEDGLKDVKAENVRVRDVAEVLAEGLRA